MCRRLFGSRGTGAVNFSLPFLLLPEVKKIVEVIADILRMANMILAKSLVMYTLDIAAFQKTPLEISPGC